MTIRGGNMVAGRKSAGAVVAFLTALFQPARSFIVPSTSPSTTVTCRAWSSSDIYLRLAQEKRRRCFCSLGAAPGPGGEQRREEGQKKEQGRWRWRGSSGRSRHRGSRRISTSGRLWGGKTGKLSSSLGSGELSGGRRTDGRASGAGVAQGSDALEGKGGSTAPATPKGVLGAAAPVTSGEGGGSKDKDRLEWSEVGRECQKRVYICTNRWCMEKGSSATLGSFVGLAPEGEVLVQGVNCLGRCNKGPNVRVRQEDGNWLEFNRIENVERVYKILRDYLGADVSKEAALCLKYNFLANAALDRNEVTLAIDYYDKAIATGYADQQGVLLVMRATAFIQRAYSHGRALSDLLQKVVVDMPTQSTLDVLHELWEASGPSARMVLLGKFAQDCEGRGSLYQKTKFRYGLYEFALLRACEDALRATETLPNYPKCWLKAGDALAALRKPKEAAGYYQVALDLDASMESYLKPKIAALQEGNGDDALASIAGF